ncbi:MAG TPA: right-handed parallel beta-helix repeat-containing protein [Bryobacteraceae bacterium]|nr:right-handed parallel beta-helix repeat-containing protein [Bryobacteraceae bacterium]
MVRSNALLLLLLLTACAPRLPNFSRRSGVIELPAGTLVLHRGLVVPEGAHDLEIRGHPSGSTLQAAADFQGRALIYSKGAIGLRLTSFRIDGNRTALAKPVGLPVSDAPFARFYANNGIVIEGATRFSIRGVTFQNVSNYPLLVNASTGVRIESVRIEDSGSLTPAGRNNASGGILLEEGTRDFEIRQSIIRRVRGNGIWTHSFYHSPRNANGVIQGNQIEEVARDAIQVGHATGVTVLQNRGRRIGYPFDLVDMAGWAVPVALDTAGNVDHSAYTGNQFEDVNGKCLDLDGFHDGEIRDNACISRKFYDEYPFAQFGIVFNNANPDMLSSNVIVTGNLIDGAGYGALYLLGSHQVITRNRFLGLNRNRCTSDRTRPRCDYSAGDPALLQSGIYLVAGAARPANTAHNEITDNEISGFGMSGRCIAAAPGVSLRANHIEKNRCHE